MEYLPINNIKQESEPPSSATNESNSSNNNPATPDSVENKVSWPHKWMWNNQESRMGNIVIGSTSFRCQLS